ncbi:MAG: hypothetical protein AAFY60_10690, partial [Myxococcota bacterium]
HFSETPYSIPVERNVREFGYSAYSSRKRLVVGLKSVSVLARAKWAARGRRFHTPVNYLDGVLSIERSRRAVESPGLS